MQDPRRRARYGGIAKSGYRGVDLSAEVSGVRKRLELRQYVEATVLMTGGANSPKNDAAARIGEAGEGYSELRTLVARELRRDWRLALRVQALRLARVEEVLDSAPAIERIEKCCAWGRGHVGARLEDTADDRFYSSVRPWLYNCGHAIRRRRLMPYKKTGASRPMKLVTVWFTEDEKAILDELAKQEKVTLSRALREGAQLYFEDAKGWIEERRGDEPGASAA
jgi:hypothetical protein